MSQTFSRILASATLMSYLLVGSFAVRLVMPEYQSLTFDSSYLSLASDIAFKGVETETVVAPEIAFNEITLPAKPVFKRVAIAPRKLQAPKNLRHYVGLDSNELPFNETIQVSAVKVAGPITTNNIALFKAVKEEMVAAVEMKVDEVSTKQAIAEEFAEPEFFDYAAEKKQTKEEKFTAQVKKIDAKIEMDEALVKEAKAAPTTEPAEEVAVEDLFAADYSAPAAPAAPTVKAAAPAASVKLEDEDLVAFDYTKAKEDVTNQKIPTVSTVAFGNVTTPIAAAPTVQGMMAPVTTQPKVTTTEKKKEEKAAPQEESETNALMANKSMGMRADMSVQVVSTNLKKSAPVNGFEVRFQDDASSSLEDFGNGEVIYSENLAASKMTRSTTILKRGFVPTNVDLIVEEGSSSISVPVIQDEVYNELSAQYETKGAVGALLVELDDETESFKIDVPSRRAIKLDENLRQTNSDDYRYELILGVKPGNTLLSYKNTQGVVVSKIVHIHENELTFDANLYEKVEDEKVRLFEEDLLSQEPSALITSEERVKEFATEKTSKKLSDHIYKTDYKLSSLAGRRYLELNHQAEPVFVGMKVSQKVVVPSESFMRHILTLVEGHELSNRCVVQLNLSKKVSDVSLGAEAISDSLMVTSKFLDSDGKFYDSASEKTKKVIIVGENQNSSSESLDGRVNVKVMYQDGSVEFVGSYCSPNTYLVEQL